MVGPKGIPRARKNLPLMDFSTLSIDETNTYNIKFCPRAIWLNVWVSRAKNTFIDLGIRIYFYAFKQIFLFTLKPCAYVGLEGDSGDTVSLHNKNGLLQISRAASGVVAHTSWCPELTLSGVLDGGVFRADCWIHRLTQGLPGRVRNFPTTKRFLQRNEGNKKWDWRS